MLRSEDDRERTQSAYEVTVLGPISNAMADELEATRVLHQRTTRLLVEIPDQAALQGLLQRVEALGLSLVEVRQWG